MICGFAHVDVGEIVPEVRAIRLAGSQGGVPVPL